MSSDDSGFDKEAEREKLREKYEQDERDRENTQRMSELLLQGATMTGKHCDRCGDPIFRYDGQEFCPTCQHEAGRNAGDAGESDAADDQSSAASDGRPPQESRAESPDATGQGPDSEGAEGPVTGGDRTDVGDEPRVEINDVRVADRHADASNLRQPPSQSDDRRSPDRSHRRADHSRHRTDQPHRHGDEPHSPANDRTRTSRERTESGDVATAREALVRKLTDLARRAEETDDVARSRELLAATREAAEALEALDRANR